MKITTLISTFCLGLFISGCASLSPDTRPRLFPDGTYQHQVQVEIPSAPPGSQHMQMKSVVKLTPAKIAIIGLSPFATTLFRISENVDGSAVQSEFFNADLAKQEKQILQITSLLREMFLTRDPSPVQTRHGIEFHFENPDAQKIPRLIRMLHDRFTVQIDVISYKASSL